MRSMVRGLRGFFLRPEQLSLLVLIDQLASEAPGRGQCLDRRGNDRLRPPWRRHSEMHFVLRLWLPPSISSGLD